MRNQAQSRDYNARLFSRGLYGAHHRARFLWLRRQLAALGTDRVSILEVGCFDGKSIEYVPMPIERYVGLDAGWESGVKDGVAFGLEAARGRYAGFGPFTFLQSTDPRDISALSGRFDVGIALETLEHVEPGLLESYLRALAGKVTRVLLVSVPNEKGIPLLVKTLAARALGIRREAYTASEFCNAVLGRTDRVPRREHKGFDYAELVRSLSADFRSVQLENLRFRWLPVPLQLTVGIVARH